MALNEDEILSQLRHKELISAINSLKAVLSAKPKEQQPTDNGVKESIDKLVKLLSNMPKPEKPVVNVVNNNDEITRHIKDFISAKQESPITKVKKSFVHKFNRDRNGFVNSIETNEI